MLELPQFLTSNYTTVTGIKTDIKTNVIEDPDINPHNFSHLTFDKISYNIR
jgi:hypothetical protein